MGLEASCHESQVKIHMKGLVIMTFATWLKKKEGFTSKSQYDCLLSTLPYEARRKVKLYYKEKYKYFITTTPKQLELNLK